MNQTQRQRAMRWRIVSDVLPHVMRRFLSKNEDYGVGSDEFGLRAQVIDISRKYKKVKAAVWDGEDLTGEPLEEVLEDMIGHCLLMLEALNNTEFGGNIEFQAPEWVWHYDQALKGLTEGDRNG